MKEALNRKDKSRSVYPRKSRGFLREASRIDSSSTGKIDPVLSILKNQIKNEHQKMKNKIEQYERQREFLNKLMPELFHDIRSPFISIIGFAEIFKIKNQSSQQVEEYSGEILDESKSALKRVDGLEDFFTAFLNADRKTIENVNFSIIISWITSVLDRKIDRKKLKVVKKFDKNVRSETFPLYADSIRILLFELLCRLVIDAGNKETLLIEGLKQEDKVVITMKISPAENVDKKGNAVEFIPAFFVDGTATQRIPGPGFCVNINIAN